MIHYFNPGHEMAVLHASKHYHPPAHVVKMQSDLAFLPAWYASAGDFVFVESPLPDDFMLSCKPLHLQVKPVCPEDGAANRESLQHSAVDLWGISPQSIHFFEKWNKKYNLSLRVPLWKDEYRFLGSRFASRELLAELLTILPELEPDILPCFVSNLESIEPFVAQSREPLLIKSPYSSSGRGLIWLSPGNLRQPERQLLNGWLKKQKQVSIEKALDKQLDFSMQFECTAEGQTQFLGYSMFQTNAKGAYEKSSLDSQERLEQQITSFIDRKLLLQTKETARAIIQKVITPYYIGITGIDMLIYQSGNSCHLHPCVEINLRKTMGYLAIRLTENYLHPGSQGELMIGYNREPLTTIQKHRQLQKQYPLIIENRRIRSGYFSLCPVAEATNYHAFVVIKI